MHTSVQEARILGRTGADVDPMRIIETIGGAALLAALMRPNEELDDAWVESLTALVLNGIAPRDRVPRRDVHR